MRRNTSGPTVVWYAEIQRSDLEGFESIFPMHGARTWVVGKGLETFLEVAEARPEVVQWAKLSIDKMLNEDETPTGLQAVNLRIPTALYERFNALLPAKGATTWFMRRIIRSTLEECERSHVNFDDLMQRTVAAFMHDEKLPITL